MSNLESPKSIPASSAVTLEGARAAAGAVRVPHRRTHYLLPRVRRLSAQVLLFVILMVIWDWCSRAFNAAVFISSPGAVWSQLWSWAVSGTLWDNLSVTVREAVIGFLLGAVGGVVLGVVLGISAATAAVLRPYIMALYSLPKIAVGPLFILWFGLGASAKIVFAASVVVFIVFYNTFSAFQNVDQDLVQAVQIMGCNRWQVIRYVVLPGSVAWILTGLRVAFPLGLMGAVVGEMLAGNQGIGYLINNSAETFQSDGVLAAVVVLMVLGVVVNEVLELLGRVAQGSRWQGKSVRGGALGGG